MAIYSLSFFLLLYWLIGSFIVGDKGEDGDKTYVFHADKTMPINFSCRDEPFTDKDGRAFYLAIKNFLYNVRQETPLYKSKVSGTDEEAIQLRCLQTINADGNCLFRAISYCLHKTQSEYKSIRKEIVQHVLANWSEYSGFVIGNEYARSRFVTSAIEYKNYMSTDREWGGNVELLAAAEVYNVFIHVYYDRKNFHTIGVGDKKKKVIALYYRGDGFYGHYSVVEDMPAPGIAEPTGYTIDKLPKILDRTDECQISSKSSTHLSNKPNSLPYWMKHSTKKSPKEKENVSWINYIRRPFGGRRNPTITYSLN